MSYFPDFSPQGYEIISELGHNLTGGRVTYKALELATGIDVVIKEFQFLGSDSWKSTEYDLYEQEIAVLSHINHRGIPKYLGDFETESGFCLVQEYINAQSLAIPRNWKLEEIKDLAISILEMLVYLQSQTPAIIHRDIKPENILIDSDNQVYLVDFGLARQGGGEIAPSSMIKGTMGFMPPEQLFNRELTTASDLYGLGVTLICLLTGIKSVDIGGLIDTDYHLHFSHLIPPMERGWLSWLEKMIAPQVKNRFASAKIALETLKSIDVHQLPRVRLNRQKLQATARQWGEKLILTIDITNTVPNTILSGWWEVEPHHACDPPHNPHNHSWISFFPHRFEGNSVTIELEVDSSQLLDDRRYHRNLILHTNSDPEIYTVPLYINTGCLPAIPQFNYLFLCLGFLLSIIIGYIINVFGNNPGVLFLLPSFVVSYIVIAEEDFLNSKNIENFNHRKMFVISNVILLSFICSMVLLGKNSYLSFSHSFYLLITTINAIACLNYLMAKKANINFIYVVYLSIIAIVVALLVVQRGIGALFLVIIIFALILTYHLTTILMASSLRLLIRTFAKVYSPNIYRVDSSVKIVILTLTLGLILGSQISILNNFKYPHLVYIIIVSTTLGSIVYLLVKNILTPILETRRLQKLYLEKHLQLLKP
jgi:serine/threonine protein kinase